MRKSLLWAALAAAGLVQSGFALAEEAAPAEAAKAEAPAPDWTVAGSVSFVSDYIFRGQSQTWGKPAAQFGVEANHKSGFYTGFFASNVSDHWLPGANLETDLYAGYRGKLPGAASEVGFDLGAIYYVYPGGDWDESPFVGSNSSNKLDTAELYLGLSYKWLSFKTGITLTEYFGWNTNNSAPANEPSNGGVADFNGDANAGVTGNTRGSYYFEVNAAYEVAPTWTVSGQVGRQIVDDSRGLDITYYKAGVTKGFNGGWSVGAFYSGTNEPDAYEKFLSLRNGTSKSDIADSTVFVSISKAF